MDRWVGKRVPRIDGPVKVTGEAQYTVDIQLPGMLCAKILRSPLPHARILCIDTTRAERLPGVRAIITGRDAWDVRHGFVETPRYPGTSSCLPTTGCVTWARRWWWSPLWRLSWQSPWNKS